MPTLKGECSLDFGCPPDEFEVFCNENKDRTVVVYANTSVQVKALSDWVVTSRIALPIVEQIAAKGEKILWAPDKYLGRLHPEVNRRGHVVVERRVRGARRVQIPGSQALRT